jgi:diacylglycerol kinase (ATP)
MPLRVLLLINPAASRAQDRVEELTAWFAARSDVRTIVTREENDACDAIAAHGASVDRIVICGGDGTISSCLPHLVAAGTPFAVIPGGTANDFARTISLPADLIQAAEVALNGAPRRIDVGRVNGRYFINVASVGVATRVTDAQTKTLKKMWRALSYVVSLRQAVRGMKPFTATIEIDGSQSWRGRVYQISVGNGRFHGGGMTVSETAALDDDTLHLYFILPGTLWQLLWGLLNLRLGRPTAAEVLGLREGRRIAIETRREMPINADGEIVTHTPAVFTVDPDALTVLTPPDLPANQRGLSRPHPGAAI